MQSLGCCCFLTPGPGLSVTLLEVIALTIIEHGSVLVHWLAKLGKQRHPADVITLALGLVHSPFGMKPPPWIISMATSSWSA
jgi:hypothetical protein